jgi:hypothetical protein
MKKTITKKHTDGFIRINISTEREYFSITADICADSTFRDSKIHACGCLHEDITEAAPELKPFIDLHLSTLDGVPMHAVENGFYWLCKAAGIPQQYAPEQSQEKCFSFLLSHLRVSEQEGDQIMGKVVNAYIDGKAKIAICDPVSPRCKQEQEKQGIFDAKNHFKKIVDSMKPRWQKEAAKALALLDSIA